jgi:protein subunit release factor B
MLSLCSRISLSSRHTYHSPTFHHFRLFSSTMSTSLSKKSTPTVPVELKINVPKNGVKFSFSRSGGPGGQNVNKVSTRATLRFHVDSASWMPSEVRDRLHAQNSSRIGKDGDFTMSSDVHRTQPRNIDDCLQRLQEIVNLACIPPKERAQWKGLGKETKRRRTESKRRRSDVKRSRGKNHNSWD